MPPHLKKVDDSTMRFRFSSTGLVAVCVALSLLCGCESSRCGAVNLGIFVNPDTPRIVGLDGCASITINDSLVMWTFGDTIIGRYTKTKSTASTFEDSAVTDTMLGNSLAFTEIPDDGNIRKLSFRFYRVKGSPSEFIRTGSEKKHEERVWPVDGIQVGRRVYLYYYKVIITGDTSAPFRLHGTGIATWDMPENWREGDPVRFRTDKLLFSGGDPAFGDSVIMRKNWIYTTGHKKQADGVSAYICRVGRNNLLSRKEYEFLDARGKWTKNLSGAAGFFKDVAGELSLSYNEHMKKYVIIYCGLSGSIKSLRFDDFDVLPIIPTKTVYTPPPLPDIKTRQWMMYYSGKEIYNTDTSIYAIFINPSIYQPILLKIPYCFFDD